MVEYSYLAILKQNPSGFPLRQVQTGAIFQVLPNARVARACAEAMINLTLHPFRKINNVWTQLAPGIFEDPNEGGPTQVPIIRHGNVLKDGTYQVIAASGRILLLGMASDRPDAFAIDRTMRAVAASLKG